MTFLLDTNACIQLMTARSASAVLNFARAGSDKVVVCSIVKAELWFGVERSHHREKNRAAATQFS